MLLLLSILTVLPLTGAMAKPCVELERSGSAKGRCGSISFVCLLKLEDSLLRLWYRRVNGAVVVVVAVKVVPFVVAAFLAGFMCLLLYEVERIRFSFLFGVALVAAGVRQFGLFFVVVVIVSTVGISAIPVCVNA